MALTPSQKTDVPKMLLNQYFQYCNTYRRAEGADSWKDGGWTWTAVNSDAKVDIQPKSSLSKELRMLIQGSEAEVDKAAFFLYDVTAIQVDDSVGIASDGGTTEDTYYTVMGVFDWDSHVEVALKSGRSTGS